MQAVVLAGGLATRLGARAEQTPKYLLPIAGRPFASWQLERVAAAGYAEVVLCIGHLGPQIRAALGDAHAGLALRYLDDGPALRGTGGALRHALAELDDSFLLTYGDSYLPFDYAAPLRDLRAHPEAEASMSVMHNEGRYDRSNVRLAGERVAWYGKGDRDVAHIDYGAIAMRKSTVRAMPEGPADLAVTLAGLAARGAMRAYRVEERFYEIGSAAGIAALEAHLGGSAP